MDDTVAWLLQPDEPGVRAQALEHLVGRPRHDAEVAEARAASRLRGGVARLIEGLATGTQSDALYLPKYTSTFHRVVALGEMGAPGDDPRVARALDACLDVMSKPEGGFGRRRSHLCVTGNVVRAATLLGRGDDPRVGRAIDWLVSQQQADGGWSCWPEEQAYGMLDAWEAMGAFAALPPARRPKDAVARGLEFFLSRRLGMEEGYAPWLRAHFPRHYYYDVLLGLDVVTALGATRDERLAPALAWLRAKRGAGGTWGHEKHHPDCDDPEYTPYGPGMDLPLAPLVVEPEGAPSKWVTLAALRVLRRVEGA